ncbi:MAG: HAD hydrolase family protein [Saprospiraceae bacterium]|nr:HAD hydrolase family protein [Saprospiraceae bacterium]
MNNLEAFNSINTFIFDVDGVLTDGNLIVLENGQLLRTMNTKDGFAMKKAIDAGYKIAIITGGNSEGVVSRLKGLGINDIYAGVSEKIDSFQELVYTYDLDAEAILYMGDDLPDLEVMVKVGLPTCPSDADHEIQRISKYISAHKGGQGCVRDVIERVMRVQGKWS